MSNDFLVYNVKEMKMREQMWSNITNHIIGKHDDCIHLNEMYGLRKIGRPKKFSDHKKNSGSGRKGKINNYFMEHLTHFLK